jgi:3',5'-cyclic AMP phosphodiesterase CpdA
MNRLRAVAVVVALFLSVGFSAPPALPAPPAPPAPSWFFMQLSDPQFGMYTADADFMQETANFEFAIAAANRLRPAFVVVTGDLVNKAGDAAQIAEYQRIGAKLDRAIPLHNVPGNHDVGNTPTPATIAAYVRQFGPDHYRFTADGFVGIVLDSSVIAAPHQAPDALAEQERWLQGELERARRDNVRHIVVFQHHPWFLVSAEEPDQYFNIARERRDRYLALFQEFGVKYVFAGHYHQNALGNAKAMEMITSGPVGKPQGSARSGVRIAIVSDTGITHRYYDFGEIPNRIDVLSPR